MKQAPPAPDLPKITQEEEGTARNDNINTKSQKNLSKNDDKDLKYNKSSSDSCTDREDNNSDDEKNKDEKFVCAAAHEPRY